MAFNNKKAEGFTLTEILLAVAIVGIIAALVIPALITKFDTTVLDHGFIRQQQAIQTAIDALPIKENKADFGDTSMFSDGTKTTDETAGKFMKRYLRVSKYYGDATNNKDNIISEGFAPTYYEYSGGEKKPFTIDNLLVGACAKLKNGSTLCLAPQVGATTNIQGIMDLNGPKGPNIYGRDLRVIELGAVPFTTRESLVSSASSTKVNTVENPGLTGDGGYGDLCKNDYSAECCNYHFQQGKITSQSHQCCSNTAVASSYPACSKTIVLYMNFFPTSTCTHEQWRKGECKPYISKNNTYAHAKNSSTKLSGLPADPPDVYVYCNGTMGGSMPGSSVKVAVLNPTGDTSFSHNNLTTMGSYKCNYTKYTTSILGDGGSLGFYNGQTELTKDNIHWVVETH